MTCTYCKTENPEDCLYCPNCGKPTGNAETLAAPTIVSPDPEKESTGSHKLPANAVSASAPERAAIQDLPAAQNARLAQANLSRMRKNWTEATELCIAVLREAPADPAAHSLLGDIYRDQNKLDEAVRWYRMALELSPNPFDQANLNKLERRINGRNQAYGTSKADSDSKGGFDPVSGSLAGGTGALLGIAPQKWLKGITVSALGFLCLFVIYIMMLPTRKIAPVPRAVSSEALVSDALSGSNGMPPAILGGPTTLPAGEQLAPTSPSVSRVAGTGLPPDLGTATVSAQQPQTNPNGANVDGIAPAPVKSVAPLPIHSSAVTGQVGVLAPIPSNVSQRNNNLTDGIQPARVDTGSGSASIQLVAASAATSRDVLVRNLFRAARTIFSNDNTLQRATVTIHADSAAGAPLLSADVDRGAALAASPNSDDLAALIGRLRMH